MHITSETTFLFTPVCCNLMCVSFEHFLEKYAFIDTYYKHLKTFFLALLESTSSGCSPPQRCDCTTCSPQAPRGDYSSCAHFTALMLNVAHMHMHMRRISVSCNHASMIVTCDVILLLHQMWLLLRVMEPNDTLRPPHLAPLRGATGKLVVSTTSCVGELSPEDAARR